MKINFSNCNNIDQGEINIEENKLNILYGVNGTGKSTLVKAITCKILNDDMALQELKPYKHAGNPDVLPSVSFSTQPKSILVYNEKYIEDLLFISRDEVMQNSFEIFIAPKNYREQCENIDKQLNVINNFINRNNLIKVLSDFVNELSKLLGDIKISKEKNTIGFGRSKITKLFKTGNVIENIPNELSSFNDFIKGENNISWIEWHNKGTNFMKDNHCPYCSQNVNAELSLAINEINALFSKATMSTFKEAKNTISKATELFEHDTANNLISAVSSSSISDTDKNLIGRTYLEAKEILDHVLLNGETNTLDLLLNNYKNLNDFLNSKKINVSTLKYINSSAIINEINEYNKSIDTLLTQSKDLFIELSKLNSSLKATSADNLKDINDFLEYSGINYELNLTEDSKKVYLAPKRIHGNMVEIKNHLSYGERNAFAIALFSLDVKTQTPDLVILDDPISSYDTNKKYAIMHYLFRAKHASLKEKTVLLLTHDFEPIINIYVKSKNKDSGIYSIKYVENTNGILSEKSIKYEDVSKIITLTKNLYKNSGNNIILRLIHYRRYLELSDNLHDGQYDIISSVLKGRNPPQKKDGTIIIDYEGIINLIAKEVNDFDYQDICKNVNDLSYMIDLYENANNNYQKLEIYRIIQKKHNNGSELNDVITNFIDQSFHIENTYLFQLNPYNFDYVPNYIVTLCDDRIKKLKKI